MFPCVLKLLLYFRNYSYNPTNTSARLLTNTQIFSLFTRAVAMHKGKRVYLGRKEKEAPCPSDLVRLVRLGWALMSDRAKKRACTLRLASWQSSDTRREQALSGARLVIGHRWGWWERSSQPSSPAWKQNQTTRQHPGSKYKFTKVHKRS